MEVQMAAADGRPPSGDEIPSPPGDPSDAETIEGPQATISAAGASGGPAQGRADLVGAALNPGMLLGDYRLARLLGRGGFADVWEAERQSDGRRLALKILDEIRGVSESTRARFEREGRLAASLSHPRIVYTFAAEFLGGRPAIALELVEGGTLQDRLDMHGPLPPREAVDAILDVIEGLEAAQQLGIVHRDIKPSNCFVDDVGRVKIGDFGISRSLDLDSGLTQTGAFLGTPIYASPEQIRGETANVRSDLYSVGATFYVLLTGKLPFEAESGGQLVAKILEEKPVPFEERGVTVPQKLQSIVQKLLSKKSTGRYASYEALRKDLIPLSSSGFVIPNLPSRFAAFLVDQVIWGIPSQGADFVRGFLAATSSGGRNPPGAHSPSLEIQILWAVATVAYFSSLEFFWQKTPGKALCHLRLAGRHDPGITLRQALMRNLLFWLPCLLLEYGSRPLVGPDISSYLGLLGLFVPLLTMRRSNGYAGLHEILTETRVVGVNRGRGERARTSGMPTLIPRASEPAPGIGTRGPYRVLSPLWEAGGVHLLLARDDALGRNVWIHERDDVGDSPRHGKPGPGRAARLRWLQGGVHQGSRWDAYEAPSGTGASTWLRSRKQPGWSETRELLLQLMVEIKDSLACEDLPASISIQHLWIDGFGKLRLLEFRAPDDLEGAKAENPVHGSWTILVRDFVSAALTPARSGPGRSPPEARQVLVPVSAAAFLQRLKSAETLSDLEALIAVLRVLNTRRASLSSAQRLGHLATCWVPTMVTFTVAAVAIGLKRDHLSVPVLISGTAYLVSFFLGVLAIPSILLAFVFRGGPVLKLFAMMPVLRSGRPASRLRCLFRAAVAHAPSVLIAGPALIARSRGAVLAQVFPGVTFLGLVALAITMVGVLIAVLRPERSFHDRIAGTRLMPK
jgi:serine/threonine protein kinase